MAAPRDRAANSSKPPASGVPPQPGDMPTLPPLDGETASQVPQLPVTPLGATAFEVPGYEIKGELGRGGMGVVYLANKLLMKRLVVLKVVNKALLDANPGILDRFVREIEVAARLDHENVVKAYHAFWAGELIIFEMEYVEGEDLAKLVKRQGPLPVAHACHYISQAAMGLQAAHLLGMVHRDIKPHNLILTRRGKRPIVKILDFGLAKAVRSEETATDLTGLGMLGTPAFMAPEQAVDAARADIRADIYGLGCTLHYLLTGAPPFSGASHFAVLKAHESAEAPSLTKLRPGTPPELEAIAAKMLAKDPAKRYQQPIDVAKALAPIIKAAPQAPKEKPPAPATKVEPAPAKAAPPVVSPSSFDKPTVAPVRWDVPTQQPPQSAAQPRQPTQPLPGHVMTVRIPCPTQAMKPEMKFAWCPPGTFLMGGDGQSDNPQHRVTITMGFWMGVYPVTQSQWQAVMGYNPSNFPGADRPVEMVSWDNCQEFCQKMAELTGKPIQLPTEAEWEYACRAGTTGEYFSGNGEDALEKVGWYYGNSGHQTHDVGEKKVANPWALFDVHGNVWEWCQDLYAALGSEIKDPVNLNEGDARVCRGGSWYHFAKICRAAYRYGRAPGHRSLYLGLRVCFRLD